MTNMPNPKQPKPSAAHKRREVLIGDWHAAGTSYGDEQDAADPRAASVPWTSDESYEWLSGSFFVLHRWDAQMGKHEFKGAEIMGYEEIGPKPDLVRIETRAGHGAGKPADKIIAEAADQWTIAAHWTRLDVKPVK